MSIDPTKRRKRRMLIGIGVVVLAIVLPAGWLVYGLLYTLKGVPDAYAKWDTGTLLIEFMETHDGQWPGGWEDLRESYTTLSQRTGQRTFRGDHTFEQLRSRIGIDWRADPTVLARAGSNGNQQPFRVVWAQSGNSTIWSSSEPNQMVLDYLRERQSGRRTRGGTTMPGVP